MAIAFNLLLLLPAFSNALLDFTPQCVDFDLESPDLDNRFTKLEKGNLIVILVKDQFKFTLGNVKLGHLTERGNCNYKYRHVLIEGSGDLKKIKIITEYHNDRLIHAEYLQTDKGKYKVLVKNPIALNLDDDNLPENLHSFHDEERELDSIKVKDAMHEFKIGKITLNGHVIEDLPNSLERIVYLWNSDDGRKVFKIDTHLNDSRLLSEKFQEESPGSKKFLRIVECKRCGIRLTKNWDKPRT